MTEDEAIAELNRYPPDEGYIADPENAHCEGDKIAWRALRELGWSRLADALEEQSKQWWYA